MKSKFKTVHIKLKGVNLNRIYKQCKINNINIFNLKRSDYKHIEFDVSYVDKKRIQVFAEQQNYEYEEDNSGYNKVVSFLKYRLGIIIGVFIFLAINIFSGLFVWDIKIYGNNRVNSEDVRNVLKSNNIKVGGLLQTSKFNDIETDLINKIEDISMCSVIKKGTTIIVNIKEKLKNSEIESMYKGSDIVATENLTITELTVANGTALKKVGDSVKTGEIIVAGYVLNASGEKINCKANASIKAKTWRTATEIYKKQIEVSKRTGKKCKISYLTLFGTKFSIKKQQNSFELFEEEVKEVVLKNNFLPFKMFVVTQYEITKEIVEQNFGVDKDNVLQKCQKKAYSLVQSDDVITNTFDTITEEKDFFVVSSYIEVSFILS